MRPVTALAEAILADGSRVIVPNASLLIRRGGTPKPVKAAFTVFIIAGGPQRWTRFVAMSGTAATRNGSLMCPLDPGHSSSLGSLMVTATLQTVVAQLEARDLLLEQVVARFAEAQNQMDLAAP